MQNVLTFTKTLILLTVFTAPLYTAQSYAHTEASKDAVKGKESQANERSLGTISVQGVGAIDVTPNAYSVTFIVEEQGTTVSKLSGQLENDLTSIVSFLLEEGIEERYIQSMQVRLSPRYNNTPQGREQDGFTLSREIAITSTDLENYDRVLDGVLKRGVDRIQQFNFVNMGEASVYQKALVTAVADAKNRAQLLAKELGVEVGEVVAISESGGNMPIPVMRADTFSKEMSLSLPGQESVNARVNVTFNINQ